jgi:hypothetical protein
MGTLFRTRRAIALIFALILIFSFGVVMIALLGQANHQTRSTRRFEIRQLEFAAAEMALNKAFAELRFFLDFGTGDIEAAVTTITPPQRPEIIMEDFEFTRLGGGNENVDSGLFVGLTLYTERYRTQATAHYAGPDSELLAHPGVTLRQDLNIRYIPLYIFGIFYDNDLEILPGPPFVQSGRVHSNGDIYVGAGESATFNNYVTSHGGIHHQFHPSDRNHNSIQGGTVKYTNGSEVVSDRIGGAFLDHDHPEWTDLSIETWNGHVLDSAHGMPGLSLPIPPTHDPHVLIEPADADDPFSIAQIKFENKAGLIIEVNPSTFAVTARDADGNTVNLTYDHDDNPLTDSIPIYEISTFRDNREGHNVTTIDVDIAKLIESGLAPDNGILYVEAENGLRLINGSVLPTNATGGFSVATNGPVFVQGDYNTINTKLSLVTGDAYNQLSNSWDDAHSTSWASRGASNTTVKSVIMAGNVPTDPDTDYSGGVENYFRFHENWSGDTFTFAGSIINMWDSEIATSDWRYGDPVYTAPNRAWDWDPI